MRRFLFAIATLFPVLCISDDAQRITEIKTAFAEWQPILQSKTQTRFVLYRYAYGENYERQEWSRKELTTEDKALSDVYTILQRSIGTYLHHEQHSFSGDWFVVSEHYYNKNGKLYFVFWKMNTFHAEEPATVEKRLYFAMDGKVIRSQTDVFKLNSRQKQSVNYMDHDVDYSTDIRTLEFYGQLPRQP